MDNNFMNKDSFIGLGKNPNPHVSDIPVGFGMELMQNGEARKNFESLSDMDKNKLIGYIQGGVTGDEARLRIDNSIKNLNSGNLNFFI